MAGEKIKGLRYTVEQLEQMGATRWTEYGHDRLYLNEAGLKLAELEISRYNTGNISLAKFKGEEVSHSRGGTMAYVVETAHIDLTTGKLYCYKSSDNLVQEALTTLRNNLKLN